MLQLLAGKKDTALYCSKWEVQLFCDFTVLETGNVHGERYLVLTWQGIDNAVHFLQVVSTFCAVECEVMRCIQMIEIVCGICKRLVTYHFTVIVDENITHDGIYPSFKVGIRCVLLFIVQSF